MTLRSAKSDPGPTRAGKGVAREDPPPAGFVYVAHHTEVQKLFDGLKIAWGVQYEIARGVSEGRWTWGDVTRQKLAQLTGTNADSGPRVAAVMFPDKERNHLPTNPLW